MSRFTDGEFMLKDGRDVWFFGHVSEADAAYYIANECTDDFTAVEVDIFHTHARYIPALNDDGEIGYYSICRPGRGAFKLTIATYHDTDTPIDRCAHPEPVHGGYRSYSSHRWCSRHRQTVSP